MKLSPFCALAAATLLTATTFTHADPIIQWTFESNLSANVNGTTGITQASLPAIASEVNPSNLTDINGNPATLTASHASASTKWYVGNGNGSAIGLFSNNWATNDYYQINANLSNYSGLTLSLDDDGSNTGPDTFKIQYSTDGSSFSDVPNATYNIPAPGGTSVNFSTTAYNSIFTFSFDLSQYSNIEALRIVDVATSAVATTLGSAGTNRLDNITISGTPAGAAAVPEPASLSLLVLSGIIILRRRNRSIA